MGKYIAKENIGDFKKGDIVPEEKAKIWQQMYDISPVEFIEEKSSKVVEEKSEELKEDKSKKKRK